MPFASSVKAANASPGTVITYVTVFQAGVPTTVEWKVSNPIIINGYNIIEFLVNAGGAGVGTGAFAACFSTSTKGGLVTDNNWTPTYPNKQEVDFLWIAGQTPLSPGSYEYFKCTFTSTAQSGAVNADTYTQTYLTQDSTKSGDVSAGTATLYVAAADATMTFVADIETPPTTAADNNLVAGTSVFNEFQIVDLAGPGLGIGGIPVTFTLGPVGAKYNASGLSTLTASGITSSSGKVNATFYPDPVIADQGAGAFVVATAGGSATITVDSDTYVITTANVPAALSISLCQFGNCYPSSTTPLAETGPLSAIVGATTDNCMTTGICVYSTDIYTNPAPAPSKISVTLGVVNVVGSNAGFSTSAGYSAKYPYTPAHAVTISLTVTILTGHTFVTTGANNFFYDVDFGDMSYLTATAAGLPVATSVTVLTNTIDSSTAGETFAYSPAPVAGVVSVQAGTTATVSYILNNVQANVPINFTLTGTHPALTYGGLFSNGDNSIVAFTNSSGIASAVLTVDTDANLPAWTHVTVLVNQTATNYLAPALISDKIVTIPGPLSKLQIVVSYAADFSNSAQVTSLAVNGTKLYVDTILTDAYNNTVPNPGPSQILVTLSASAGALSSGSPTIPAKCVDLTDASPPLATPPPAGCIPFGTVTWLTPVTVGTVLTLTASTTLPALSNSITLTTVSSLPMLTVQKPVAPTTPDGSQTVYSPFATVTFSGVANVSLGYAHMGTHKVTLVSLGYSANGSAWKTHPLTGSDSVWSVAIAFKPGLSTVQFNVTDSLGNVYVTPTMNVLVDTKAPTIGFTTANKAVISAGAPVTAWAYDLVGGFNTSSVVVKANSVALPAADIAVTPLTNTLGSNSSFVISITGLTAGTWILSMTASTYAGVTAAAVSITVTVTVASGSTFTSPGAAQCTTAGITGVCATLTNNAATSETVNIFVVWYNVQGQEVSISIAPSVVIAAGGTYKLANAYPVPGQYTAKVFVQDTLGDALSTVYPATITVT